MTLMYRSVLAAILICSVPLVTYAGSMRCGGKIIAPGLTEQELLNACGNPTSRNGDDWLYKKRGDIPMVVSVARGVVTYVRNLDESGTFRHPYGDRP